MLSNLSPVTLPGIILPRSRAISPWLRSLRRSPLFSSNVTSGPSPLPVQFYDNSSNYPTSWLWSFGDGTTSSVQNPMHIFSGDGTYAVTLTAMNAGGNRMTALPGYITVSEATATPAPTTPYATVSPEGTIIAPEETTVAVAPDVTVANVSAPVSTGNSPYRSL